MNLKQAEELGRIFTAIGILEYALTHPEAKARITKTNRLLRIDFPQAYVPVNTAGRRIWAWGNTLRIKDPAIIDEYCNMPRNEKLFTRRLHLTLKGPV